MQTNIVERYADTDQGREAEAILRKCVHCGFCTATCPTYQLLGCLLYTSPSPRDLSTSRMPSSA